LFTLSLCGGVVVVANHQQELFLEGNGCHFTVKQIERVDVVPWSIART
jgi:hypothetical protein